MRCGSNDDTPLDEISGFYTLITRELEASGVPEGGIQLGDNNEAASEAMDTPEKILEKTSTETEDDALLHILPAWKGKVAAAFHQWDRDRFVTLCCLFFKLKDEAKRKELILLSNILRHRTQSVQSRFQGTRMDLDPYFCNEDYMIRLASVASALDNAINAIRAWCSDPNSVWSADVTSVTLELFLLNKDVNCFSQLLTGDGKSGTHSRFFRANFSTDFFTARTFLSKMNQSIEELAMNRLLAIKKKIERRKANDVPASPPAAVPQKRKFDSLEEDGIDNIGDQTESEDAAENNIVFKKICRVVRSGLVNVGNGVSYYLGRTVIAIGETIDPEA